MMGCDVVRDGERASDKLLNKRSLRGRATMTPEPNWDGIVNADINVKVSRSLHWPSPPITLS